MTANRKEYKIIKTRQLQSSVLQTVKAGNHLFAGASFWTYKGMTQQVAATIVAALQVTTIEVREGLFFA